MSFPLAGNERLRESLESVIASGRIPHAILIEGDKGLGHHTLARYLAQAAVCSEREKPCGLCRNCHLAEVGTHPDLVTVAPEDGKKNITVDKIRELRQLAFVKPHMADSRVFLIERADAMNEQSQNALLKILEEPPAGVIFLLLAESKTALLDTIVSRCVVLTLSAPAREQALVQLRGRVKKSDDEVAAALDAASNNIGLALGLLSKKGGGAAEAAAKEFLRLLPEGSEYEMLRLLAPFEKDRVNADVFFRSLKTEIARELRQSYTDAVRARILDGLYEQIGSYEELLKTNINLSLLFSAAVCRAARLRTEAQI